ncbi:uncharacterized protein LOC142340210 [Convolutriloba macropyga]|uniref:uncharacterized protein LOC142340210 n=1 Tax=Convolutriloba macropyga TaxID=536237 RepID=UPI003F522EEA
MSSREASSSKLPECVICTEILEDPRQLPCGHCYCGPLKPCLNMLKQNEKFKCAICSVEHKIDIEELKPMYGLRDYLKDVKCESTGSGKSEQVSVDELCQDHNEKKIKYWCKVCEELLCGHCISSGKHKNHEFVDLLHNFQHIITTTQKKKYNVVNKKCKELLENVSEYEENLKKCKKLEQKKLQLEDEYNKIYEKWTKLESMAEESDASLDMGLLRWLLDDINFKAANHEKMPDFGMVNAATQTPSPPQTQAGYCETRNKRVGTEITFSLEQEAKAQLFTSTDEKISDDHASSLNDYEQSSPSESFAVSSHAINMSFNRHTMQVPFDIKKYNSTEIEITYPYNERQPGDIILWSVYLMGAGGIFRLGIQRLDSCLAVYLDAEFISGKYGVTVEFDRFTRWESKYWIWQRCWTSKESKIMFRKTDVNWHELRNSELDIIVATVTFSPD